jgi:hypothetical protein
MLFTQILNIHHVVSHQRRAQTVKLIVSLGQKNLESEINASPGERHSALEYGV